MIGKKRAALFALMLIATPLAAGDDDARRKDDRLPARDEIPEILDYYMLSHLQERLGLNDAQNARLVPLVMQYQKDSRTYRKRRMKTVFALKKLLNSGSATEAQLVEHLTTLRTLESDDRGKLAKDLEAVDASLSVVQQAKFRVLEQEVEHRFFQLMKDAIGPGGRLGREGREGRDGPAERRREKSEEPAPSKP